MVWMRIPVVTFVGGVEESVEVPSSSSVDDKVEVPDCLGVAVQVHSEYAF